MYCITYPFIICAIISGEKEKRGCCSQTENKQGDAVCFSNLSGLKRHNYPKKPWLIGEMLYYVQIIKHPDLDGGSFGLSQQGRWGRRPSSLFANVDHVRAELFSCRG